MTWSSCARTLEIKLHLGRWQLGDKMQNTNTNEVPLRVLRCMFATCIFLLANQTRDNNAYCTTSSNNSNSILFYWTFLDNNLLESSRCFMIISCNRNYGSENGSIHYWVYTFQFPQYLSPSFVNWLFCLLACQSSRVQKGNRKRILNFWNLCPPEHLFRCNLSLRVTIAVFIPAKSSTVAVQCFEDVVGDTVKARFHRKASGSQSWH